MKYPNTLRYQRTKVLNKTIEDIAIAIGVTIQTVYRWERGVVYAQSRLIQRRMFDVYGTSPKDAYPTCWQEIFPGVQREIDENIPV